MLNPTVRENLLFPSSSPSARRPRRFLQVQSMVADGANSLTRIQNESILLSTKLTKNTLIGAVVIYIISRALQIL